ncbi:MAG: hypothetical protein ACQETZ_06835, partial [Candidatus Fermentibacterota bacterium]
RMKEYRMTDRFPESYARPRLEKIGGELIKGWAACDPSGSSLSISDCQTGDNPGANLFNPSILGEGL